MVLGECRRRNVPQIWQLLVEKVRGEIKISYHSHFLPHVFTSSHIRAFVNLPCCMPFVRGMDDEESAETFSTK